MKKEKKQKPRWLKVLLIILAVILTLVVVVALVALLYINNLLDKISRTDGTVETLSPEQIASIEKETENDVDFTGVPIDPLEITWGTAPSQLVGVEQNVINIMLIGQDKRVGQGRQRSDAMILCTLNVEKKTLTMTSFLRDTYVQIPGYADNRLNLAYQLGGMPLLDKTLEVNYGVHVDANIEVDFSGFEKIVDMVGGLDLELSAKEVKYLINQNRSWKHLKTGVNHLDGAQTLHYTRIRYIDNDFYRTNRQRIVLTKIFERCKQMPFSQLMDLVEECIPLVTTDMTNLEIMRYAVSLIPLMGDIQVNTQHIPAEGTYWYKEIRSMHVILPNLEANRRILLETIGK